MPQSLNRRLVAATAMVVSCGLAVSSSLAVEAGDDRPGSIALGAVVASELTAVAGPTGLPGLAHHPHSGGLAGDFDGDGVDDVAVGVPGENANGGVVNVVYGSADGLVDDDDSTRGEMVSQQTPGVLGGREDGDAFGASLAIGDFDGDDVDDLAVGVPGENANGGVVNVVYGSVEGLVGDGGSARSEMVSQQTPGVAGGREDGDAFGASLAVGDFDQDGFDDLIAGVPGENSGSGIVNVLYGSADGLVRVDGTARSEVLSRTTMNGGNQHRDDAFGASLTVGDFDGDDFDDVAIGVRDPDGSGTVYAVYGATDGLVRDNGTVPPDGLARDEWIAQRGRTVPGGPEPGDAFGASLAGGDIDNDGFDDLAIGVPGENDLGGVVQIVYGSDQGLVARPYAIRGEMVSQQTPGVPGGREDGDAFGASLAIGDFDDDSFDDVAVGVPGENSGGGVVNVLYGSADGLVRVDGTARSEMLSQQTTGVPGTREAGDAFGASLVVGRLNGDRFDDVALGVPGENSGGGIVQTLFGSASGLTSPDGRARSELISQQTPGMPGGREAGDAFGSSLA